MGWLLRALFLSFLFILFAPESIYAGEEGKRSDEVTFNVEVAKRDEKGRLIESTHRDEHTAIGSIQKGLFPEYGDKRLWGIAAHETFLVGCVLCGGYKNLKIAYSLTSKNGFVLNVDPTENVQRLFAEQGIVIPPLSKDAAPVVITNNNWSWKHLRVRTRPEQHKNGYVLEGNLIDNVINGQRVWVTDVQVFTKREKWIGRDFTLVSVWARIYSLYSEDTFIKIGHRYIVHNEGDREGVRLNIRSADWKALVERFPILQDTLEASDTFKK